MPINTVKLHGPQGSTYLAHYLSDYRDNFNEAKKVKLISRECRLDYLGVIETADTQKIHELVAETGRKSFRTASISQSLIDALKKEDK